MPQIKQNFIDDIIKRRQKLFDNAYLIEAEKPSEELILDEILNGDTSITIEEVDKSILSMIESHGFLIGESDSSRLDLRVNSEYFNKRESREAVLEGFNLGERIYRLASKILLKYQKHEGNNSRIITLNELLSNVPLKKAIDYMDSISDGIGQSKNGKPTPGIELMLPLFDELFPIVVDTFRPFYNKIEALRDDIVVYKKHKNMLDEAYFQVVEEALNIVINNSENPVRKLEEFLLSQIKLRRDKDPQITLDYLNNLAKNNDYENAIRKLEHEHNVIIVGLEFNGNRNRNVKEVALLYSDRYMQTGKLKLYMSKLNQKTNSFLKNLGQQILSINVSPYSDHHDSTKKASINIGNYL